MSLVTINVNASNEEVIDRIDLMENKVMSELDNLKINLERVATEVTETGEQIRALRDEGKTLRDQIDALKEVVADRDALLAGIEEASATAGALADKLDSFQDPKPPAPIPDTPENPETPSTDPPVDGQ